MKYIKKNYWVVFLFLLSSQVGAQEALYKTKCASCHGLKGVGSAKLAKMMKVEEGKLNLAGADVQKISDEALLKTLLEGQGKMPAYKTKITTEEAKKLIQYIRSFNKK